MPDCGVVEVLKGGMIAEAHITASSITESRVTSSTVSSCQLESVVSVDTTSAQVIANALAELSEGALLKLAQAIAKAMPKAELANGPQLTTETSLPSTMAGSREALLGKPDEWLAYHDFVVPGYKKG